MDITVNVYDTSSSGRAVKIVFDLEGFSIKDASVSFVQRGETAHVSVVYFIGPQNLPVVLSKYRRYAEVFLPYHFSREAFDKAEIALEGNLLEVKIPYLTVPEIKHVVPLKGLVK